MTNIPTIIPSLRKWAGLGNYLALPESCRLVIDPISGNELVATVQILHEVLCVETRRPLPVTIDLALVKGDIFLKLDKHDDILSLARTVISNG